MTRFGTAWRAAKRAWGEHKAPPIVIRIYISDKTLPEVGSLETEEYLKSYKIKVASNGYVPETIAHELGHFISQMQMNLLPVADYAAAQQLGYVTRPVLIEEARAWRWALKMYPQINRQYLKEMFMSYVRYFVK